MSFITKFPAALKLSTNNTSPDSRFHDLVFNLKDWDLCIDAKCSKCLKESSRLGGKVASIVFVDQDQYYSCDFPNDKDENHDSAATGLFIMNMINIPRVNFNVKYLTLRVDSEILRHIGHHCKGLKGLTLYLKSTEPHDFSVGFENLEELSLIWILASEDFMPAVLGHIASLPNLTCLELESDVLEGEHYAVSLPKFKKLKHLDYPLWNEQHYRECQVRMNIFRACTADLTSMDVGEINDWEIQVLLDNCPNLKNVCLSRCGRVNGVSPFLSWIGYGTMFTKLAKSLEELKIDEGSFFPKRCIDLLVESDLARLKVLDLDVVALQGNDLIPVFKKYGKQLEFFKITLEPNQLTDEVLAVSARECPNVLKSGKWDISEEKALTEAGISKFIEIFGAQLVCLYACGTHISDNNIKELSTHCPNLKVLDLGFCQDITVLTSATLTYMKQNQSLNVLRIQGSKLAEGDTETALKSNSPSLSLYEAESEVEVVDYRSYLLQVPGWGKRIRLKSVQ